MQWAICAGTAHALSTFLLPRDSLDTSGAPSTWASPSNLQHQRKKSQATVMLTMLETSQVENLQPGGIFLLNGGAISWSSKFQPTVAQSTIEAEYYAARAAAKEALYLRKLQRDLGLPTPPTEILTDYQSSLVLIKYEASSSSTKHIDFIHHSLRNNSLAGDINFSYTSTQCIAADYLTKAVPKTKFLQCLYQIGMATTPT
jgi:hypothetical protein